MPGNIKSKKDLVHILNLSVLVGGRYEGITDINCEGQSHLGPWGLFDPSLVFTEGLKLCLDEGIYMEIKIHGQI